MAKKIPLILLFMFLFTACVQQAAFAPTPDPVFSGAITESPAPEPAVMTPSPTPVSTPPPTPVPTASPPGLPPYEAGQIMIVMYHGLAAADNDYDCTAADFRRDLQTLYDQGFRLLSLHDLMDNNVTTPAGFTPVVLTFDDGRPSAFSLVETENGLVPAPDCAVAVLEDFCGQHPDFGRGASLFVNGSPEPFKGAGTLAERFAYLLDHGYTIENHGFAHAHFAALSAAQIQEEIGKADQLIRNNAPGYTPRAVSYPYGERPLAALRSYVLNGLWEGQAYHYDWGLREGQSGAAGVPNRVGFDPLDIPRVRGTDVTQTDLGWTLRQYQSHPERRYISDGDPATITVPRIYENNVDKGSLDGKELILTDGD